MLFAPSLSFLSLFYSFFFLFSLFFAFTILLSVTVQHEFVRIVINHRRRVNRGKSA